MRPIDNNEQETDEVQESTPIPSLADAASDEHDAPTALGRMSPAIAELIEAERERAESGSAKSGVRAARPEASPSSVAPRPSRPVGAVPTLFGDEESANDEPTVLSKMAPALNAVLQRAGLGNAGEPLAESGELDVVAATIQEMESSANEVIGAELKDGWEPDSLRGASFGSNPPPLPSRRPNASAPPGAGVPSLTPASDGTRQGEDSQRRQAPRAAFPEWIGISVNASDLSKGPIDKQQRARLIMIGVGTGVISVIIGFVWWLFA